VDDNHREMIRTAEGIGHHVIDLSKLGLGVPDLAIIRPSDQRCWLVEVKGPKGKLTPAEQAYATRSRTPIYLVRTVDELLEVLGVTQ
jgi:hypothetical protein